MIYYVVMAGGRGERFWPKSRSSLPKQFLNITDDKSLLQCTIERLKRIALPQQIYIVTNEEYSDIVFEQIPEIPKVNILLEPYGRDTAAAIGYAAIHIYQENPNSVMAVLPADHAIDGEHEYLRTLTLATHIAALQDTLVTIGIKPTRPETGYGYIECGNYSENGVAFEVKRFREKPDTKTAKEFITNGNFLWNSGMFVWKTEVILDKIKEHLPEHYEGLQKLFKQIEEGIQISSLRDVYNKFGKVSIDYGILERANNIVVVPANFTWDDVGSWLAMERMLGKDINDNSTYGPAMLVETSNCIIYSTGPLVATTGIENLVVVATEDAVLVCTKEKTPDLKQVIGKIKDSSFQHIL